MADADKDGSVEESEEEKFRVRRIELIMALRSRGIRDTRVLAAVEKVPRHLFIENAFEAQAYADHSLPIECGQTISQPFVVAYMTEKLQITDRHKVLEVGTGSGYQAAVLSYLARRVYTIERYRTLSKQAEARFAALGITNITTMVGDGMQGWPAQAPFDRIMVTAASVEPPPRLMEQLKPGGLMILPLGPDGETQYLTRIERSEEGEDTMTTLLPVRFVPLVPGTARQL